MRSATASRPVILSLSPAKAAIRARPKGSRSLAATVRKVLGRKIPVIERGQRKLVSADEAMLHRYLEMALKGDVKAGAFLLGFLERFQPAEADDAEPEALSEGEKEVLAELFKRKKND